MSNLIGRRYAKALFDIAKQSKAIDKVEAGVDDLIAAISESGELRDFINSPLLPRAQQAAGIAAIAKKAKYEKSLANTLGVMADKRRLDSLPQMLASFKSLAEAERGTVTADVTTAVKMTKAQSEAVAKSLNAKTGKDVKINEIVDPTILGGMIVSMGSTLVDSSIKSKLSKLQTAMKEVG